MSTEGDESLRRGGTPPTGKAGSWFLIVMLCLAPAGIAADARLADAVERGNRDAVSALLVAKAGVNAAQVDGMTALHWAAQRGDLEMAATLGQAKIHFGVNVVSKGTPVKTKGLKDYGIPPRTFAADVLRRYAAEYADMKMDCSKVRAVP